MPVTVSESKVSVELANGSAVEILVFGANVISWRSPNVDGHGVKERFFLSKKSALDGSKAVRGGIPIVFPFFGSPNREEHKVFPSHGFGRTEKWKYDGIVSETKSSTSVKFVLEPSAHIKVKFPFQFILQYIVTISLHELSTTLRVTNPASSTSTLTHQALLHNYIAAHPSSSITIAPLTDLTYTDKVKGGVEVVEQRALVDVKESTDSVYKGAPGEYHVRWTGGGVDIKTTGFPDVVVWNPQKEIGSKMADMEDGGWERYVCVEPGFVSAWNTLAPGETWVGTQIFRPL
ncbi:hypothetical protein BS47DRAFT_1349364 [Hydnum rufescens UP504]|uniref:Glucose-6-phosphate 1-epimerase n=1 Tax=Hydnum rufescens UP504 TaxID=1448309 RepID=A0A9P6AP77_9AGAM|nr:hypothetical protein BS47DRAFT_1349364 [Hydnum rufescens UP504]